MINPHNSPWNKPKPVFIKDKTFYYRWKAIEKHLTSKPSVAEYKDYLVINGSYYIAKHSPKMRIKSHLDWCWYTPKTLAQAIDSNTVETYYEVMLSDVRSDPNEWKDLDFEMELKSFYANRVGRCSLI